MGGIGIDGYIAFNKPASSLTSRTRIKKLTEDTRIGNSRFFGGDLSLMPKYALTVGVGTLLDAEEVMIPVTSHTKAASAASCSLRRHQPYVNHQLPTIAR